MTRSNVAAPLAALVAALLAAPSAPAAFHLWTFSEFFSNADGSVQFIEIVSSGSNENQDNGAQIRTDSGNVFNFPGTISGNTLNKRVLIATAGFGELTGAVTPDYILPTTNFFNPNGDRIRLFSPLFNEFHSRTFTSVPTDGIMSLNYPPTAGVQANNTPTNFAGAAGSVNLSAPPTTTGDYNGDLAVDAADYTVWRDTLGAEVSEGSGADGDADGMIDEGDYDFWKEHFGDTIPPGAGSSAVAVPEPTAAILLIGGIIAVALAAVYDRKPRRQNPHHTSGFAG